MLGDIDKNLKPRKPQVFLCTPTKTTIAKLHEAYGEQHEITLGNIDTFTFYLPYQVEKRGKVIDNKHIDQIQERYLIKIQLTGDPVYYIVTNLNPALDGSGIEALSVKANLLPYQLSDKTFNNYVSVDSNYNESPININQALSDALSKSPSWSIGSIDSELTGIYREFKFTSKTALDFIFDIAKTFNAIIEWDTDNKKVNMKYPDNIGQNKGLTVSYGKYLKTIDKTMSTDNLATRFYAYGSNDVSIRSINTTGSDYIEDFSFFLYPYSEDANGNVIQSSNWMSDSLAGAILDYNAKVDSKDGEFNSYLDQQTSLQSTLSSQQTDMSNLQSQLAIIDDNLAIQKASDVYHYYDINYNGSTTTITASLENTSPYAIMAYVDSSANLSLSVNGVSKSLVSGTWVVVDRFDNNAISASIDISGSATNDEVKIYVVQITTDQYTNATDQDILDNYNDQYKQSQIDAKQSDIDSTNSQLNNVQTNINNLQSDLSVENNFTAEQINEWDNFIISRTYRNDNCVTAQQLMDAAKKEFDKYKSPPPVIQMNIVNFLEVVEAQRDWNKLVIGDIINIKYERLGINIQAKLTKINIDYSNKSIQLTISNIKDILTDEEKYIKSLYQSVSTSTEVTSNKKTWDQGKTAYDNFNSYVQGAIDATKQAITAGTNESVTINRRGIQIKDPNYPNDFLVANNSVLAITNDGGETWKNALTKNGLIAERLIGQVIIGSDLTMINSSGKFTFDENGATISGTSLTITDDGNGVNIDPSKGIIVDNGSLTITGGLPDNQIASSSKWNGAIFEGDTYNGVVINTASGITVTRSDNLVKTILNATEGIKIQGRSSMANAYTDQFYVDTNGNAVFKGNLNGANGTFSGDLSAAGGTFTGTLQGVDGDFSGSLSAATGTFAGSLNAASGTFKGSMTAGSINGVTITGSDLISESGSNKVDISNGEIQTYLSGHLMTKLQNYNLVFYDSGASDTTPDYGEVGYLASAWDTSTPNLRGMSFIGSKDYLAFGKGSSSSGSYTTYFKLDFNDQKFHTTAFLQFDFERPWQFVQYNTGAQATLGLQSINANKEFIITDSGNYSAFSVITGTNGSGASVTVYGDFSVTGAKNALIKTDNYGERFMYSDESTKSYFNTRIKKTLEPGKHNIKIDPMFLETISEYDAFPMIKNGADVRIVSENKLDFDVEVLGDFKAEVVFFITGVRKGFENVYMAPKSTEKNNTTNVALKNRTIKKVSKIKRHNKIVQSKIKKNKN